VRQQLLQAPKVVHACTRADQAAHKQMYRVFAPPRPSEYKGTPHEGKTIQNARRLSRSALPLPGQLSRARRRNYWHGNQSAPAYTASKRDQARPRPGCIVFFGGFGLNGGFGAEMKELLHI